MSLPGFNQGVSFLSTNIYSMRLAIFSIESENAVLLQVRKPDIIDRDVARCERKCRTNYLDSIFDCPMSEPPMDPYIFTCEQIAQETYTRCQEACSPLTPLG